MAGQRRPAASVQGARGTLPGRAPRICVCPGRRRSINLTGYSRPAPGTAPSTEVRGVGGASCGGDTAGAPRDSPLARALSPPSRTHEAGHEQDHRSSGWSSCGAQWRRHHDAGWAVRTTHTRVHLGHAAALPATAAQWLPMPARAPHTTAAHPRTRRNCRAPQRCTCVAMAVARARTPHCLAARRRQLYLARREAVVSAGNYPALQPPPQP